MIDTPLNIVGGLPYNRRVRVVDAALTWPTEDDFEVKCHLRVSADSRSRLKADLSSFIDATIEDNDIVLDLRFTGSQTRELPIGYYDIVISDPGGTDDRAIRALKGQINVSPLTTAVS